jgi:phosphoglycerol transferase MdoB-like AlkP superfamily enzyme
LQYDRIPLLILVPGRESELALHAKQYRDVTGGLHDLMPTILHLLGQPTPYGVMGSHLFVPNVQRSPLLLPVLPESFVYAGMMSSLSKVVPIATPPEPLPALPPFEVALREQLVVQDMMDHPDLHLQHPDAK